MNKDKLDLLHRNHGQSDRPQPGGTGRALDVVELMDYLKIQKAHIHGYSMGGGFVAQAAGPAVDLSKLSIPIMAVNGSFDNPYGKTIRLWREVRVFENVILPERTHLTAIGVGAPTPQLYIDSIASFIDTYDQK